MKETALCLDAQISEILERRWPLLPEYEATRRLTKYHSRRIQYRRVRRHAIRSQLDALIGLTLDLGLSRKELFLLRVDHVHHDNESVVIWRSGVPYAGVWRSIEHTDRTRAAIERWLSTRDLLGVGTDPLWVSVYSEDDWHRPMTLDRFSRHLPVYIGPGWTLVRLKAAHQQSVLADELPTARGATRSARQEDPCRSCSTACG